MKIAVLGGAFNPPHIGHQLIAKQVLKYTKTDQVWIAPCYQHTFDKNLAPVKDRVAMAKMLTNKNIRYCHEEIKNKLLGDTIDLMEILKKKYKSNNFSFIIGSDNLKYFKKWGNWQKLVKNFPIFIFPRPGFNYNLKKNNLDNKEFKWTIIKHPKLITTNVSSTQVRQRIKKNQSIKNLVPEKIRSYIKKNKLYT